MSEHHPWRFVAEVRYAYSGIRVSRMRAASSTKIVESNISLSEALDGFIRVLNVTLTS
jgi:hypothetical protein